MLRRWNFFMNVASSQAARIDTVRTLSHTLKFGIGKMSAAHFDSCCVDHGPVVHDVG